MLFEAYVRFHIFSSSRVTEWPPIGELLLTRLLQYVFLAYVPKCHFSFFPPLGLWSGDFFLIAPFPDHYLLVPSSMLVFMPLVC